jgi:hypothetical protein
MNCETRIKWGSVWQQFHRHESSETEKGRNNRRFGFSDEPRNGQSRTSLGHLLQIMRYPSSILFSFPLLRFSISSELTSELHEFRRPFWHVYLVFIWTFGRDASKFQLFPSQLISYTVHDRILELVQCLSEIGSRYKWLTSSHEHTHVEILGLKDLPGRSSLFKAIFPAENAPCDRHKMDICTIGWPYGSVISESQSAGEGSRREK